MNNQQKKKVHPLYVILGLILISILFITSINVIIATILGIGIGVIMGPTLTYFRNKFNIPRALSAFLCLMGVFIVVSGVTLILGLIVSDQAQQLIENAPTLSANLDREVSSFFDDYPRLKTQFNKLNIVGAIEQTTKKLFLGVQSLLNSVALAGFAFVISLYVAVSLNYYFKSIINFFSPSKREKVEYVLKECADKLRGWFKAQLLVMVILGFITSLGLWLVGVKYWALYGLLTAVFSFIPYMGIFIVVTCAALVTFSSNAALVPWVIVVFIITQQIEGNVVIPMLMKEHVELPEVPLLIFVLLCGSWIGVIGVFIAPPLFTILKVLYVNLYTPWVEGRE